MYANSRPVSSSQLKVHTGLAALIQRHLAAPFRKPLAAHNIAAFAAAEAAWRAHGGGLILDSGCGTGASTRALALRHPAAFVIGVDKSARRLTAGARAAPGDEARNCVLVRADLVDFWRLAFEAGWRLQRHYLLYPNPWPKRSQLARRWCAHPVFPVLLALGGRLELRSNWEIYVQEFAQAAAFASGHKAAVEALAPQPPLSPFERKYRATGQPLFRCIVDLRGPLAQAKPNTAAATPSTARPMSAATGTRLRRAPAKATV